MRGILAENRVTPSLVEYYIQISPLKSLLVRNIENFPEVLFPCDQKSWPLEGKQGVGGFVIY